MTPKQIEALALEAYPERFIVNIKDKQVDVNGFTREIYAEGLTKASELLFTEEQIESTYNAAETNAYLFMKGKINLAEYTKK